MSIFKKREAVDDRMTLPMTASQKERYKRLQHELEKREYNSLHEMTRERIDLLLDEVERELDCNVRIEAC